MKSEEYLLKSRDFTNFSHPFLLNCANVQCTVTKNFLHFVTNPPHSVPLRSTRKSEKLTATIRFGSSRHLLTPFASPKSQTKFIIFKINLPLPARAVVCLIPDATLLRLRIVATLAKIFFSPCRCILCVNFRRFKPLSLSFIRTGKKTNQSLRD